MYALWHKKKEVFLAIQAEKETKSDWTPEGNVDWDTHFLRVFVPDPQFAYVAFATPHKGHAYYLAKNGSSGSGPEEVRIAEDIDLKDLEVVKFKVKKKKHKELS